MEAKSEQMLLYLEVIEKFGRRRDLDKRFRDDFMWDYGTQVRSFVFLKSEGKLSQTLKIFVTKEPTNNGCCYPFWENCTPRF